MTSKNHRHRFGPWGVDGPKRQRVCTWPPCGYVQDEQLPAPTPKRPVKKAPVVRVLGVQTRPDHITVQVEDHTYKYEVSPYIVSKVQRLVREGANGKALQLLRRCPLVESPAPVNASTSKDIRAAYVKGAKDERRRLNDVAAVPGVTLCIRCDVPIPFPHATGLCKLCEVESRVE